MEQKIKVCIRSSGPMGIRAYELIRRNFDFEIVAFMEHINYLSGDVAEKIPIQSQYRVWDRYKNKEIDKIIIPGNLKVTTLLLIERELKYLGIHKKDIIIIPAHFMLDEKKILTQSEKQEILEHHEFNYLKHLEFHVADHCNLNCANCSHFAPFVKKPAFPDLAESRKDFERVGQLVDNIQFLHLLGGEPLLNPELDKYIEMAVEIFPCANVYVTTNGILLQKMSDKLVECIRKNNVQLNVASYPPLWSKMDEMLEFLKKKKIRYNIIATIGSFCKLVNLEKKVPFPYRVLTGLPGCNCKDLYKGKIAICPTVGYSKFYDQYHNTEKMEKLSQEGFADIYKVTCFEELRTKLETPCALCDYCMIYRAQDDVELQEDWKQMR